MTEKSPSTSSKVKQSKKVKDTKTENNIDTIRETVRTRLPSLFMEALEAYQLILSNDDDEDHKRAQSRHNAAKTALMHIQQLIRLSDWATQTHEDDQQISLETILSSAREEIESQQDEYNKFQEETNKINDFKDLDI